jgi:hypothetical protein
VALGIKFDVNPLIPFDAKDAVVAKDELIEVVANELDSADVAKDELIEVVANELDSADVAKDAVPNSDPVNEPVNEPVLLKNAFQELPL